MSLYFELISAELRSSADIPAFTHNYFQVSKSILNEERKILDSPHFDDELHVLKKERTMVAEQVRASGGAKRKILPGTAGKILTEI